jgi:hypothetical protein
MARPKGSRVVKCPAKKCGANVVGIVGKNVECKKCGNKFKLTKDMVA